MTATYPLTLPADAGTAGQALTTDGGTATTWTSIGASTIVQTVYATSGSVATGTTVFSTLVDTIPTNTAGVEYMSLSITPSLSTHHLNILVIFNCSINDSGGEGIMGLYKDSVTNALQVSGMSNSSATGLTGGKQLILEYDMTAGTTSSITFKVRAGADTTNTFTFNGDNGTQYYGGVSASSIVITEYVP